MSPTGGSESKRSCCLPLRETTKSLARSYLHYTFHSFFFFLMVSHFPYPISIDRFFPCSKQGSCYLFRKRPSSLTRKSTANRHNKPTQSKNKCAHRIFFPKRHPNTINFPKRHPNIINISHSCDKAWQKPTCRLINHSRKSSIILFLLQKSYVHGEVYRRDIPLGRGTPPSSSSSPGSCFALKAV